MASHTVRYCTKTQSDPETARCRYTGNSLKRLAECFASFQISFQGQATWRLQQHIDDLIGKATFESSFKPLGTVNVHTEL